MPGLLQSLSWSNALLCGRGGSTPEACTARTTPTAHTAFFGNLSEFLSQLSSDPQSRDKFGPCLDKLLALRDQHDPLLFTKELFNIGCELADRGMTEGAVAVLAALVGAIRAVPASGGELPLRQQNSAFQDILARAQEHLNALQGNGNILPRVEYLAKQMPKEIFNLSGFSAMAAAMPTFRFTTATAKAILGTGIGPWLAANTIGFLAESAMFTSVGRGVRELIDGRGDSRISHPTWAQEWVYGMPMLLGLKTFGGLAGLAGHALLARGYGYTALQAFSLWGMHQVAMLNGIMFGNHVSEPAIPGRDFWMQLAEAGVTAVHFNAINPMLGAVANPHEALRRDFAEIQRHFNERSGLSNSFGLVTADGVPLGEGQFPKSKRASNLLLSVSNKGGGSGSDDGPSNTRVELEPHSFSSPSIPIEHSAAPLQTLIRSLRSGELPLKEKARFGAELYQHIDSIRELLNNMIQEDVFELEPANRLTSHDAERILQTIRLHHFEGISDQFLAWSTKFNFLREQLRQRFLEEGTREEKEYLQKLFDNVDLKFLESGRYYHDTEAYFSETWGVSTDSPFNEQRYPSLLKLYHHHLKRFQQFVEGKPLLQDLLKNYHDEPIPRHSPVNDRVQQRSNVQIPWKEVCELLSRRSFLKPETLKKILYWCEKTNDRPNNIVIFSMREDAMAGLIDFLAKGTHSHKTRELLIRFLDEVVQRDDEPMMEVLAIRFGYYRLGNMRDRRQIQAASSDPLTHEMVQEADDRFLQSLKETAEFYHQNPGVRGPYLEVIEKIQLGKGVKIAELAVPIWHQTKRLLQKGYQVGLTSRTGTGEAILYSTRDGSDQIMGVTSILSMTSRADLEHRLDLLSVNLTHHVKPADVEGKKLPLIISIQIPKVRSGLSKKDLMRWTRDYLELHQEIAEIQLVIPDRGVAIEDPMSDASFRIITIDRNLKTTENRVRELEKHVQKNPRQAAPRLELYRLRREFDPVGKVSDANLDFIADSYAEFPTVGAIREEFHRALTIIFNGINRTGKNILPDIDPGIRYAEMVTPNSEHLKVAADFINRVLGISLPSEIYQSLINLSPSDFSVRNIEFKYGPDISIQFSGELHDQALIREPLPFDNNGHFTFRFFRNPQNGVLQASLEDMTLPHHLRGHGVGTLLFSEFVRLCREMPISHIFTEDANGLHVRWGWQFRTPLERDKMIKSFENFAEGYMDPSPRLRRKKSIDLSAIAAIQTPQQLFSAYYDPRTRSIKYNQERMDIPSAVDSKYQIGKIFFNGDRLPTWAAVFDTRTVSGSSRILEEYVSFNLWNHYADIFDENH